MLAFGLGTHSTAWFDVVKFAYLNYWDYCGYSPHYDRVHQVRVRKTLPSFESVYDPRSHSESEHLNKLIEDYGLQIIPVNYFTPWNDVFDTNRNWKNTSHRDRETYLKAISRAEWIIRAFQRIDESLNDILYGTVRGDPGTAFGALVKFAQDVLVNVYAHLFPTDEEEYATDGRIARFHQLQNLMERILFELKAQDALKLMQKHGFLERFETGSMLFSDSNYEDESRKYTKFASNLCFVQMSERSDDSPENVTRLQCNAIAMSMAGGVHSLSWKHFISKLAKPPLFDEFMLEKIVRIRMQFPNLIMQDHFERMIDHLCSCRNDWKWTPLMDEQEWNWRWSAIEQVSELAKWKERQSRSKPGAAPTADQLCLQYLLNQQAK